MTNATSAPQTADVTAPVQLIPRKAQREITGIRTGVVNVMEGRGFDPRVVQRVLERDDWVPQAVREPSWVGINGVGFFIGGPDGDEPSEVVTLPQPIALILREQHTRQAEAVREWRARTSRLLGGSLDVRDR